MKAWVLGDPGQVMLVDKPVPQAGVAEVLVRVDACAICATDLEVISHGAPALIDGEPPFNKNFTPGHEYMGTIVSTGPTVDEFRVGERIAVEIHAGCGRCERCRQGMYTSCYLFGIRGEGQSAAPRAASLMAQQKIDPSPVHTHTFTLDELPTALRYARDRVDGAIKVVVKPQVMSAKTTLPTAHAVAKP